MNEVTLSRPVIHEGKTYDKITIDEPTVAAIEAYQTAIGEGKSEVSGTIAMIAVDTGWPQDVLRKIRSGDFRRIAEAMTPFTEGDGETGDPLPQK